MDNNLLEVIGKLKGPDALDITIRVNSDEYNAVMSVLASAVATVVNGVITDQGIIGEDRYKAAPMFLDKIFDTAHEQLCALFAAADEHLAGMDTAGQAN